jgi:hypothetical protein
MYTEAMLRAAFADWQIEHLAAYDAEIDEGTGHRGRSALIDLVARRPGEALFGPGITRPARPGPLMP